MALGFFSFPAFATILNEDDRTPIFDQVAPWDAVGKIVFTDDSGEVLNDCTATLVQDSYVATAAHCFIDPTRQEPQGAENYRITFYPALRNPISDPDRFQNVSLAYPLAFSMEPMLPLSALMQKFSSSGIQVLEVMTGTFDPFVEEAHKDWAIATLAETAPQGMTRLKLGNQSALSKQPASLSLVGYDRSYRGGNVPLIHEECSIRGKERSSLVFHDCDTSHGSSGAPLIGKNSEGEFELLAIHTRGSRVAFDANGYAMERVPYSPVTANRGVEFGSFLKRVRSLIFGH